jgi:hypothetical protein
VSDRHGRSLESAQGDHLGVKLLRERFDNARAETGFSLGEDAVRLPIPLSKPKASNPSAVPATTVIRPAVRRKRMLQAFMTSSVTIKPGSRPARCATSLADNLPRDRPIVIDHDVARASHNPEMGDFDGPGPDE